MDNRFFSQQPAVENGGMFSRQKIQQLTKQAMNLYGNNSPSIEPQNLARCMIDTYRGMNKHFIPTGYELSSFARQFLCKERVFDKDRKGYITEDDLLATATRLFLANNGQNTQMRTMNAFR